MVGACLLFLLLVVVLIAGAQHAGQVRGREVLLRHQTWDFAEGKPQPRGMRFRDPDRVVRLAPGLMCSATYVYDRNHFVGVMVASVLQIDSKAVAARKTVRPPPGRAPARP